MTFLEMSNAGHEATDKVRNEIQSAFQQAYDILRTAKKIEAQSNSSHLPNLEIAMANFQEPDRNSKPAPEKLADPSLFEDPKVSKVSDLLSCETQNCKTKDSHFEQYITRDANGRVLHTNSSVPKYEYDADGKLTKVTFSEGKYLGDLLTGADMFKPTICVLGADGKWRYSDTGAIADVQNIQVDQHTGECTFETKDSISHLHANGTSHTTDLTGEKLLTRSTLNSRGGIEETRSYQYDALGNLQEVHYWHDRQSVFGDTWSDKWVRQEDGSWVNIKDGKPTARRLKDIRCAPDGTHIEVEYPCQVNVYRLDPSRRQK